MGHLVKPTAYRLGHFSNWHDNWISTNSVVYTEVLHNTLVLRKVLEFFFEQVCKKASPELIFSHYSMILNKSSLMDLKIFFYDSEVERKFQGLYRVCRKLNRNQKMLFNQLLQFFSIYNYTMNTRNIKSRKLLYRWFSDRGFFDYLMLRRLVFFFFLIVSKENILKKSELLQIRLVLILLLEYYWRKSLTLGKQVNVFDFFINFFLQFDNLLKKDKGFLTQIENIAPLFLLRHNTQFIKSQSLIKLIAWFKGEDQVFLSSKENNIKSTNHAKISKTFTDLARGTDNLWSETALFKKLRKEISTDSLFNLISQKSTLSLLSWTFLKLSHNVWYSRSSLLKMLLENKFVKYRTLYRKIRKLPTALNIWTLDGFLDFYRLYLVRSRYQILFTNLKNVLTPFLNRLSLYPIQISFFGFDNDLVSAEFLAAYLSKKFEQRFQIKELFGPISKDLRRIMGRTPLLLGYKLQFVGRLTRRDRLRTSWIMAGKVPVSSMDARVEHGCSFGILRNGVCSIRVWLYRSKFFGNNKLMYLYKVGV